MQTVEISAEPACEYRQSTSKSIIATNRKWKFAYSAVIELKKFLWKYLVKLTRESLPVASESILFKDLGTLLFHCESAVGSKSWFWKVEKRELRAQRLPNTTPSQWTTIVTTVWSLIKATLALLNSLPGDRKFHACLIWLIINKNFIKFFIDEFLGQLSRDI